MLKRDDAIRLIRSIAHHAGASVVERSNTSGNDPLEELAMEVHFAPYSKPNPPVPRHGARRYKVLHIEDPDRSANLVFYYLRANYDVDSEPTGELALARAIENEYDYIILDLDIGPGMSALDFAELVREAEHYASVPIIALATYHSRQDVERCMQAGCTAFLSKPFLKEDLLRLMEELEAKVPDVK
ncbi:MAG TPA: response regulator [Candidatus Kapabacteria bacterium]|nr:response regulator [Candidatus Kapabacteria bacterium]